MSIDVMETGTYRVTYPCGHVVNTVDEFGNGYSLGVPVALVTGYQFMPCPHCGAEATLEKVERAWTERWHYTINERGDIVKHVSPHEPAWKRGGRMRRAEYVHSLAQSRIWELVLYPGSPQIVFELIRISHLESPYHVERLYYPLLEAAG